MPMKKYLRMLIPQLINAAKRLIPTYWQEKGRPTLRNWFNKINEIHSLEYLRFSEGMGMEDFEEKWRDWAEFKCSMRCAEVMGI